MLTVLVHGCHWPGIRTVKTAVNDPSSKNKTPICYILHRHSVWWCVRTGFVLTVTGVNYVSVWTTNHYNAHRYVSVNLLDNKQTNFQQGCCYNEPITHGSHKTIPKFEDVHPLRIKTMITVWVSILIIHVCLVTRPVSMGTMYVSKVRLYVSMVTGDVYDILWERI